MGRKPRRKIRAFVAIKLPDRLKKELGKIQRCLGEQTETLRFVRQDQLHITLAFLGWVSEETLKTTVGVCQNIPASINSFSLFPTQLGAFPRISRPSVVWVGLGGGTESLVRLTKILEAELSAARVNFFASSGELVPHITLARVGRKSRRHQFLSLRNLIEDTTLELTDLTIPVKEIVVYQSDLRRQGPQYIPLATIPLATR